MAVVKVSVDSRGATSGAKKVLNAFDKMIDGARKLTFGLFKTNKGLAGTNKQLKQAGASATAFGRAIKGALAFLGIRQVIAYADAWQNVNNRLRLVTDSTEELAAVQQDLFEIAQATRVGLEGTAELYQRLARASEALGKSTGETLEVTENVSKAITISGVSAQAAEAAIVQLGQGLAAGALRGDELRSVLEQTPRLAQAIADGMGVAVGELRELGQQGKLTAKEVFEALQSQGAILEEEFGEINKTIGQSFTQLRNAGIRLVGILSEDTGATKEFGSAITALANFISGPLTDATVNFSVGLGELGETFGFVTTGLSDLTNEALKDFELIGKEGVDLGGLLGFTFANLPLIIRKAFLTAGNEITSFIDKTETKFELFKNTVVGTIATAIGDEAVVETALAARAEFSNDLIQIEKDRAALQEQINLDLDNALLEIEQRRADRQALLAKGRAGFDDPRGSGAAAKDAEKLSKEAAKGKQEFDELRSSVILLQDQLRAMGESGEEGVQFINDIERAAGIFDNFNGELDVTEDQVLQLVQAEREYTDALALANEQLQGRQDALAGVADVAQSVADLNEQLLALEEGGEDPLKALTDVEALQQAREIIGEFGSAIGLTTEDLQQLIIQEQALTEELDRQKQVIEDQEGGYEILTEFGIQAARNIQTAFADFLYDPFADGLDGMLAGFVDTLRKMAAEALSQEILKGLFTAAAGAGGPVGAIAGTLLSGLSGRANGGPVATNEPVVVGENEAEIFTPRTAGTILNQDQIAGLTGAAAAPEVNVTVPITNVSDPSAIPAGIESTAGQKAVMNVLQQNPEAVKRALS